MLGGLLFGFGSVWTTLLARQAARRWVAFRFGIWAAAVAVMAWLAASVDLGIPGSYDGFSGPPLVIWGRAAAVLWVAVSFSLWLCTWAFRAAGREFHSGRRRFLGAAGVTAVCGPVVATGFGTYIARKPAKVTMVDLPIANLDRDLEGLRLVHLSDIHLSPFLSRRELRRVVDLANELRANVALVTGDLITSGSDPLDDCLAELRRLRADAGVFGCLGNHEIYARAEDYVAAHGRPMGLRFLRGEAETLRFGGASLNIAGVDYQRKGSRYLPGAEGLVRADAANLLLSHNPDVFPVAAAQGFDAMLSGHTHGGQVRVEILHQSVSPALFYTPYTQGLYTLSRCTAFVTSGVGTVGVPVRLGTEPEIALISLRRG